MAAFVPQWDKCTVCRRELVGVAGLTPPIVCGDCMAKPAASLILTAVPFDERRAAALWNRLVTAWDSDDGEGDGGDSLLGKIGALVDEWHDADGAPLKTSGG